MYMITVPITQKEWIRLLIILTLTWTLQLVFEFMITGNFLINTFHEIGS